jgi:hypothetical protein
VHDRVQVTCRHGSYPGIRSGRVCAYEFSVPEHYEIRGTDRTQRAFVLLDEHIQLQNPLTFLEPFEEWWYVDLVQVHEGDLDITVVDHWLDVAVPPDGQPYRVMDGDEFADAVADGKITLEQATNGIRRLQEFLDRYLHGPLDVRGFDALATGWHDFPPKALAVVRSARIN